MRLLGAVAALTTCAWAADGAQASKRVVMVCMNAGPNGAIAYRGQATAAQIFKQAGVQLKWRSDASACAKGAGIVVTVSREVPLNQPLWTLAYAQPFDRTRIVLFYDRVLNAAGPAVAPLLLGHVLAHEITHVLQDCDHHSASGIMKAHWDKHDYDDMRRAPLRFTQEDLNLIDRGAEWRASRLARAE
ncbi:MAG TPA: hypothetical protein VMT15_09940 [Bryobacteraceae bacterium]|nr:hypothetical protein [Bryobacteraceae bacterium]